MYSRSTSEVDSNRVTSSLLRKRTRLPTNAHEVRALTFEVTDNFGSNVVLPCGAYGPWSLVTLPGVLLLKSPVMKRAAMRSIFSMLSMFFFRYRSQTTAPYSRMGRTREVYACCLQAGEQRLRFLCRKPNVEVAFLVMAEMWESHVKSLERRIPR